ncbi:hypothetical protein CHLRE_08g362776v5 [Chlamydomonas reinhardtii]|uniref:Uncharacterized protein n=1 Tax=Chlamydomonas reinhardtii TaxID=3055 RepID=A0A2K3DGN0_CHLRE|nr:uncharacterized protein CHLRE_08g362776v5 [Chlamydomonas reinhardtii]PNW79682.1 hypothetical protein CHLRE_08g362776v5 [Chlamydomonas reinhardtii]
MAPPSTQLPLHSRPRGAAAAAATPRPPAACVRSPLSTSFLMAWALLLGLGLFMRAAQAAAVVAQQQQQ